MSLSDALKNGPAVPTARNVFPESVRSALPEEEYEALLGLLARRDWTADALSQLLRKKHCVSISPTTIRTWRRANLDPEEGV